MRSASVSRRATLGLAAAVLVGGCGRIGYDPQVSARPGADGAAAYDGADGAVAYPGVDSAIAPPGADGAVALPGADGAVTYDGFASPLVDVATPDMRGGASDGPAPADVAADLPGTAVPDAAPPPPPPDAAPPAPAGVSTLAGSDVEGTADGLGTAATFSNPVNVAVGPTGDVFVADFASSRLRRVTPAGQVTTVSTSPDISRLFSLLFDAAGTLYVGTDEGRIVRVDPATGATTVVATGVGFARGLGLLSGGRMVVTDYVYHVVRIVDLASGTPTVLAGRIGVAGFMDSSGAQARFDTPVDIAVRPDQSFYVADVGNHRIRLVTPAGVVTTYAGTSQGERDGPRLSAQFSGPAGLALDGTGALYVSDRFGLRIRKIGTDSNVTTIAGTGIRGAMDSSDPLTATFSGLEGIDLSPDQRTLYIADGTNGLNIKYHRVRQLTGLP